MRLSDLRPQSREKVLWTDPGALGKPKAANTQWLWAVLPALPLVLLTLRLWLLSRGELQVMLLLIQHVSPVGLVTAMIINLIWIVPAVVLTVKALSALLLVSDPESGSRLARETDRLPGWVVWLAVVLAALTWQLRFLPTLLATVVMIVALDARRRCPRDSANWRFRVRVLPVAALLSYFWLAPGIATAFRLAGSGNPQDAVNGLLLAIPPAAAVVLTGPVPSHPARVVIRWTGMIGAGVFAPVLVAAMFARAPILPSVAIEIEDRKVCGQLLVEPPDRSSCVLLGQIIAVDDRMVTVLRRDGSVAFVPVHAQHSQVLCRTDEAAPASRVEVRGWHIEHQTLVLILPPAPRVESDPRCQGRPLSDELRATPVPTVD